MKIFRRRGRKLRRNTPKTSGIAFVELVISTVIFGWVLLAIFPLFLSSVESNVAANSYGEVNRLARNRLEQLLNLPFDDPLLSAGRHPTSDLPTTVPEPETGGFPSTVPNPFRRTYRVEQFAIPPASALPRGALFAPARVISAGLRFDYKRIDVTVEAASPRPGLGCAARVSAIRSNPAPEEILSRQDPDP